MNNPLKILQKLESHLTQPETLTLYGKAAIVLGFPESKQLGNDAVTMDVDAILPMGDLETISNNMDFWDALGKTNEELEADGLYMTHLFQEDQVILSPDWQKNTIEIDLGFRHLKLQRPSTLDLILTKMMRGNDPKDMADIQFLLSTEPINPDKLSEHFKNALVPDIDEIKSAFLQAQPTVLALATKLEEDNERKIAVQIQMQPSKKWADSPEIK